MKWAVDEIIQVSDVLGALQSIKVDYDVRIGDSFLYVGKRKGIWLTYNSKTGGYEAEFPRS